MIILPWQYSAPVDGSVCLGELIGVKSLSCKYMSKYGYVLEGASLSMGVNYQVKVV